MKQINAGNVAKLTTAWSLRVRPEGGGALVSSATPIVVEGVMYYPIGNAVIALEPDTGKEIWRHPIHTREFGSQITNVLRCLQLESHGYQVTVTELVGWEHSMKNELIVATYKNLPRRRPSERLQQVLAEVGLEEMAARFYTGDPAAASAQPITTD